MTDPRITPTNGRVAHVSLEGQVEAEKFVQGRRMMVMQPMANITDEPRGKRVSQLLFGEVFHVLETDDGFAFGQAERDGQVGYMLSGALASPEQPTHWITAPATHLYPKPDLKAPPEVAIFFGSQVKVVGERDDYVRIHTGHFIPRPHLQPIRARFGDPVGVADLFLGSPYLWGGSSRWGIDCSGLVQMALLACGVDCPRDSDQQMVLGRELHQGEPFVRGDLVFWQGHVGFMANERMLLHANATHMAVAYEPLKDAAARIEDKGEGPIAARRRFLKPGG
ncbi:C40 family peptidase [Nioella ostreopsis]|uniref:C40 family peptidase n=1 Tax=Nioella ostreopsis TaxID=2448479 RepID=UPI000FD7DA22|nr:NlpC/P60 family protein [Nioella ostreopsis]